MTAGYEDDPRWQAARDVAYSDTSPDESPSEAFQRRVAAQYSMFAVEVEYEQAAS